MDDAEIKTEFAIQPQPEEAALKNTDTENESQASSPEYSLGLPRFGKFDLTFRLGTSSGGDEKYLCTDSHEGPGSATFFIKLRTGRAGEDPEALERFQKDYFVGSTVLHRHVLRSFELIRTEQGIAVVSEYASRGTLAEYLGSNPVVDVEEILRLFIAVCEGVSALHDYGIVHGQISPSHVFFFKNGEVKIGDFGFALLQDPRLRVKSGSQISSPLYAPPEYLESGMTSGSMDIYALGLLLFEMVTGVYPFRASNMMDRVTLQVEAQLPDLSLLRPDCPRGIQEVVSIATRKDPSTRYATVEDMILHLSEGISPMARVVLAGKSLVQRVKSSIVGSGGERLDDHGAQGPQSYVSSSDNAVYVHRSASRMGAPKRRVANHH